MSPASRPARIRRPRTLALAVLAMGLWPLPFTEVMHASVNELLRHVAQPKI